MNIQLRNNHTTTDPRLDRLVLFDDRSRAFPIRPRVEGKPLRSYTWRCLAHLDQGNEGACVGFGITHELIARPAEAPDLDAAYAREQIYWNAQRTDPWPGGAYPGAWPHYEGTSVLAGIKVARNFGWFDSYHWAFGLDDVLLGLAYDGPCVFGLNWYDGMLDSDSQGFITPTGRLRGGHCILGRALDIADEKVLLHNSWGYLWGENGCAWITFADLEVLLHEDGEAAFFENRHVTPQPKEPRS